MKRIGLIVVLSLCVVAGIASAQSGTVTSVNAVGYSQVQLPPNGRLIFAHNFDSVSGGTNTFLSIFGTNQLTSAVNYLNADRITVWLTAQSKYQNYAMYNADNQFYPCNTLTEWDTASPTNPAVQKGVGMWLVRASGVVTTNVITTMGQVVTNGAVSVGIVPGYQLVGYPFSSPIAISNINVSAMRQANNYLNSDRIVTWENNAYQNYGLYTDGQWYKCNTLTEWDASVLATHVIQVGEGMWFIAQTNQTWSETNKYLGTLQAP